ncbi:MAG: beta-glucosidase [Candidatus Krumholzibacteriota bacterium]|nr:beta-glucosidase [Candidatus Krumholzibacteriota bacterium]
MKSGRGDAPSFPPGFLWGAATSAYQVEGSPLADGGGESNWRRFARVSGRVRDAAAVDRACDHYRRWPEDVRLMQALGLNAYRFSVAWARVLPAGTGAVNAAGLDFYERLVDALLAAGIAPCLTLYHWDHPAALDERGGWLNPDSAEWFARYAEVVYAALGDRVALWATLNEPWVVMDAGYLHGTHAPGHRDRAEAPRAAHNLLRAHGAGITALRAAGARNLGIVLNLEPKHPASGSPADRAAAARADAYMNGFFLDALLTGDYPEELPALFGRDWPDFPAADLRRIRQPLDWIGVNYYTRAVVRHDPGAGHLAAATVPQRDALCTETGWEVYPPGLGAVLDRVWRAARPVPVYITENGAAFADPPPAADGRLADPLRVDYLRAHLREVRAALARGVDLRGYFVWSLLDNLEWAEGLGKRFGIVHVDHESQRRTIKASGRFYAERIRAGGDP